MPRAAPGRPLLRVGTPRVNLLSEAKSRPCPAVSLTSHGMRVAPSHSVVGNTDAWIRKCANKREATMSGFYDAMAAKQARKAFSLVTASQPSWLPSP